MSNTKTTNLGTVTSVASGDIFYIVDISDTSQSSSGTSKRVVFSNIVSAVGSQLTAITGLTTALTVAQGGTGVKTLGSGKVLLGAGTGAVTSAKSAPTGDFVGTSDTQNLSNKTFTDQTEFSEDINLATDKNVQVNDSDPDMILELPAGSWTPTTTSGCADIATVEAGTNDIDYKVLDFDASSDENAFTNFSMPTNWDGGVIQFKYVWTNAGGGSAEVLVLELSGRAYADNDAIDQAVGTPVELADTWVAQGDIHISAFSGDVTLAGTPAGGQWVHLELMRDVAGGGTSDTLTGDCRLISVQIKYKTKQYSN